MWVFVLGLLLIYIRTMHNSGDLRGHEPHNFLAISNSITSSVPFLPRILPTGRPFVLHLPRGFWPTIGMRGRRALFGATGIVCILFLSAFTEASSPPVRLHGHCTVNRSRGPRIASFPSVMRSWRHTIRSLQVLFILISTRQSVLIVNTIKI